MTGRLAGTANAALIGRDRECARIDRLLDDAVGGESRTLVIRGEAGIGKTALLEYAAARSPGMTVLRVGGVESESDLAFAGLLGLLRPVLGRLDGLVEMQRHALAGALGLAEARAPDRFLVSAAVLGLLAAVADDGPLLCVVDDANWLDTPSAEALVFAARRLRAEPVAILFAAREGDERQFEAVGLPEVALTGVDDRSAETLLAGAIAGLTPEVRSRLLAEAAGNPLALLELPRGLSDAQLDGREPLPDAIPLTPRLQQGFRRQIEQLPEPSRLALLITAAEGTGELATLLGALAALELPSDSLDAAQELGLIRITELRVTFRHPLVRAAVLERATLSQRQRAHAALAATLSGDEQVDRRVWHQAMATLTADDEVAAALAASAKRAELRGAHASAATAFERAAALTTDGARNATWLGAATHAAWTAGQPDRTRDLLNRALPLAEGGQRARLLYIGGLRESRYGNLRDGVAILLDAADASDTPALTLELLLEAGYQAADAGQRDRVPELAARASDLPEPTLEARFRKTVLTGLAAMYTGEFDRAQTVLSEAIEAAAGLPDDPGDQIWAAYAAAIGSDLGAGLPFATRAVELARSQGRLGVLPAALEQQALQLYWSGQFGSAYAAAQEGYRLSLDLGRSWGWHLTLTTMAGVEAIWGRESEARDHGAAVLELAQRSGQMFVTATVRSILGLARADEGQTGAGSGHPRRACDGRGTADPPDRCAERGPGRDRGDRPRRPAPELLSDAAGAVPGLDRTGADGGQEVDARALRGVAGAPSPRRGICGGRQVGGRPAAVPPGPRRAPVRRVASPRTPAHRTPAHAYVQRLGDFVRSAPRHGGGGRRRSCARVGRPRVSASPRLSISSPRASNRSPSSPRKGLSNPEIAAQPVPEPAHGRVSPPQGLRQARRNIADRPRSPRDPAQPLVIPRGAERLQTTPRPRPEPRRRRPRGRGRRGTRRAPGRPRRP